MNRRKTTKLNNIGLGSRIFKMKEQFTAYVYCKEEKIATQTGNDLEKLYTWMLTQVNGNFYDIHGEIIDNQTKEVVRTFRKASME